ncbi:MAG: glutamate--tRNA ligase, partial [Saprospiraceae bacterium]|nr:glutamate--tRNA ligase [Saprospiraceae bacterium]
HIGGVRTALYNVLFARKNRGTFILRIEDTDQNRYVSGAENYIMEALDWCGLTPDEGPKQGGNYGPYRQSERKHLYGEYAQKLIDSGNAYYAFDTPEELQQQREEFEKRKEVFRYDSSTRMKLSNSLTLSEVESRKFIESGEYTIRIKIPADESITVHDIVRGEVTFDSNQLDDKVILKSDGMPTYHLANIVDDHLMEISHVVRGEEWLPSTAHHLYLYRFLGWGDQMPQFAHLPLILKPSGKGKLSKRDGAKLGIPVFPLAWKGQTEEDSFQGFREFGFLPDAANNFLAFLGWNPGTEQEIFSLKELEEAFTLERVSKSGARFDFDKALWFNQQYLIAMEDSAIAELLQPLAKEKGFRDDIDYLSSVSGLMKERVHTIPEILETGYYCFTSVKEYEEKMIRKKWKPEREEVFKELINDFQGLSEIIGEAFESTTKAFMEKHELGFGDVLPILRLALSGTMKGPSVFDLAALLGKDEVAKRMTTAIPAFNQIKAHV